MPSALKIALGVGCGIVLAVAVVMVGCFGLLGLGVTAGEVEKQKAAKEAAAASAPASYQLELIGDWRHYHDSAYSHAEGEVKNVSGRPLRGVQAVVTWYTAAGAFVKAEDAIVEYNPLAPGQVSPFHVLAPYEPEMDNAKLKFKLYGGEALAVGTAKK